MNTLKKILQRIINSNESKYISTGISDGFNMLAWYVHNSNIYKVIAKKISEDKWEIEGVGVVSDGHDIFRNHSGASKYANRQTGRSTKVSYLRIIDGDLDEKNITQRKIP